MTVSQLRNRVAAQTTPREVPGAVPPGPKGEPVLGNARRFQRDLIHTLIHGRRQYGDVVRFDGIGPLFPVYLVAHPDGVKHVLQDNHRNYPKTPFVSDRWRALVGDGLICNEGDFWRRQRRLAQPAFHRQQVARFGRVMTDGAEELLERWDAAEREGAEVDVTADMTRLTLGVLGQALFGADWRRDADDMAHAVEVTIGEAYRRFGQVVSLPESVPTPANRRFARSRARLDEVIYRVIDERVRTSGVHPDDLLEALMTATADDGSRMPLQQVRNEVVTFMFGGHETVASGLTWSVYLLSKHPEVARRLEQEVDQVLAGRVPTVEDLARMPYLDRVVRECLRLYPPVSLISRTPLEDDVIAGYRIPKGSMVLLSAFITQRHPEFWTNPEGFDPDRWSPEADAQRHRFAWWPFSGGPRKCIGDYFGLLEMQLALSMVAQRFRVGLVPGHPVVPKPGLTLGQQYGVVATLQRRDEVFQPLTTTPLRQSLSGDVGCPVTSARATSAPPATTMPATAGEHTACPGRPPTASEPDATRTTP